MERTRGALDYVYIKYIISQVDSTGINYSVTDFSNSSGTITFLPWQRSEVNPTFLLTIHAVIYKPAGEYLLRVPDRLSYQSVYFTYFLSYFAALFSFSFFFFLPQFRSYNLCMCIWLHIKLNKCVYTIYRNE